MPSIEETNRALAHRWFDEVWNRREEALIDELFHPEASAWMEGYGRAGRGAFREQRTALLTAFSDLHVDAAETVAQGDVVVVRWRFRGTHDGDGLGIAATGLSVDVPGITWIVFRDGQIVDGWDAWNQGALLAMLQAP